MTMIAFRAHISCTSCCLLLLCLLSTASAQESIPIGKWRTHISFNSVTAITGSDTKVYAAAANGLMVLDKGSMELSALTSLNGLTGKFIHAIHFDGISAQLLV